MKRWFWSGCPARCCLCFRFRHGYPSITTASIRRSKVHDLAGLLSGGEETELRRRDEGAQEGIRNRRGRGDGGRESRYRSAARG